MKVGRQLKTDIEVLNEVKPLDFTKKETKKINDKIYKKDEIVEYYNRKYLEKVLYDNDKIYSSLIEKQKIIFNKDIPNIKPDYNNTYTLNSKKYLNNTEEFLTIYNKLLTNYYNIISKELPTYVFKNIDKKIYPEQLYLLNLFIKPYSFTLYNNVYNKILEDEKHNINSVENMSFDQSINFYQQFDDLYYILYLSGYDLSYDDIILLLSYSNFDIDKNLSKYQLLDIFLGCIKHIYNKKYLLVLVETILSDKII